MVTPPPSIQFFFLLPDADNEEAVRRKTCCVGVQVHKHKSLIFNHSFIEMVPPSFAGALTTCSASSYRM